MPHVVLGGGANCGSSPTPAAVFPLTLLNDVIVVMVLVDWLTVVGVSIQDVDGRGCWAVVATSLTGGVAVESGGVLSRSQ